MTCFVELFVALIIGVNNDVINPSNLYNELHKVSNTLNNNPLI